jgi:hypothetical protein
MESPVQKYVQHVSKAPGMTQLCGLHALACERQIGDMMWLKVGFHGK